MYIVKIAPIILVLLVVGCSSENEKKCQKYADMEVSCGEIPKDERDVTRKMAAGFCKETLKGNDMLDLGAEIECAQKHKNCAEYKRCIDESADSL